MNKDDNFYKLPYRTQVIIFLFLFTPLPTRAECESSGTCYATDVFIHTSSIRNYRINASSFAEHIPMLGGVNATISSALLGADAWNEQSNGGHFRYMGITSTNNIPNDFWDCYFLYPSFEGIIVAVDDEADHVAVTEPKCGGYSFRIKVYKNKPGGFPWLFSTGTPQYGRTDFAGLVTHELGHTQNILHPACGEKCTMEDPFTTGTIRQRDLSHYDQKCSWEVAGQRDLTPYYSFQSYGSFGSEEKISVSADVYKSSAGVTKVSGSYELNAAFLAYYSGIWLPWLIDAPSRDIGINSRTAVGPTAALWREDEEMDRVFYVMYTPSRSAYLSNEAFGVSYKRSSDGFVSHRGSGNLYKCDGMSSWMRCDSNSRVESGKRIAVAWDDYNDRSVIAWAHLDRANCSGNGEIRISTGYIENYLLPEPDSLDVNSSVSPGVACSSYQAYNNNDCMVAYVEQGDALCQVKVKTFYSIGWESPYPPHRYEVQNLSGGSAIQSNIRTTSGIAAWYQYGRFYIAIRPVRDKQRVEVWSSSDGYTNWTQESSFGSNRYSAVAPSIAGYFAEVYNTLVYSR